MTENCTSPMLSTSLSDQQRISFMKLCVAIIVTSILFTIQANASPVNLACTGKLVKLDKDIGEVQFSVIFDADQKTVNGVAVGSVGEITSDALGTICNGEIVVTDDRIGCTHSCKDSKWGPKICEDLTGLQIISIDRIKGEYFFVNNIIKQSVTYNGKIVNITSSEGKKFIEAANQKDEAYNSKITSTPILSQGICKQKKQVF